MLIPRLGRRKLSDIDERDVLALVQEGQAAGLAASTIANRLKPLSGIFAYAVFPGRMISPAANPMRALRDAKMLPSCNATREHREWTSEEVSRLIRVAYERDARKEARGEYGLSIELKLRTGLRLGELLGLQYQDLIGDKDARVLLVRRQLTKDGRVETPKTKASERRVPLPEDLALRIFKRKLEHGAGEGEFVFAPRPGLNPPSPGNWRRRGWNAAVRDAKLTDGPKVTPHDARHAFVSQAADLGLSSDDVAGIVGHTSAKVTEGIYLHSFNRDEREQRQREVMARMAGGAS